GAGPGGRGGWPRLGLGQRRRAIGLGLARAEQVQVGAVDDQDLHGDPVAQGCKITLPVPDRSPTIRWARAASASGMTRSISTRWRPSPAARRQAATSAAFARPTEPVPVTP